MNWRSHLFLNRELCKLYLHIAVRNPSIENTEMRKRDHLLPRGHFVSAALQSSSKSYAAFSAEFGHTPTAEIKDTVLAHRQASVSTSIEEEIAGCDSDAVS